MKANDTPASYGVNIFDHLSCSLCHHPLAHPGRKCDFCEHIDYPPVPVEKRPPAWLALPDAVDHTGTTARTIRRWIAAGRVRSKHIEGLLHVDLADLNRTEAATRRHGGRVRLWDKRRAMS